MSNCEWFWWQTSTPLTTNSFFFSFSCSSLEGSLTKRHLHQWSTFHRFCTVWMVRLCKRVYNQNVLKVFFLHFSMVYMIEFIHKLNTPIQLFWKFCYVCIVHKTHTHTHFYSKKVFTRHTFSMKNHHCYPMNNVFKSFLQIHISHRNTNTKVLLFS